MWFFEYNLILFIFCQVILESFPVSSSGHTMLLSQILKRWFNISFVFTFPKVVDYFLHGPTIVILLIFFRRDWFDIFRWIFRYFSFDFSNWRDSYKHLVFVFLKIVFFVIWADFFTVIFYLTFQFIFDDAWFFNSNLLLVVGFCFTSVILFSLYFKDRYFFLSFESLDFGRVGVIGFLQGVALLPGVSRMATTYVAARWLNVSPRRAFQFSLLIQFPLLVLAFSRSLYKMFEFSFFHYLCNIRIFSFLIFASVISYLFFNLVYWLARKQLFWIFGLYLIFPILVLFYFLVS